MRSLLHNRWLLAVASALLQILIFPIAGPVPAWRSAMCFLSVAPLLIAILHEDGQNVLPSPHTIYLLGYLSGLLWYIGSFYWIYSTMNIYGGMPPAASLGILLLYSLILANYHALFCLMVVMVRRRLSGVASALAAAPFLWVAAEIARTRIMGASWNVLGTVQVDNLVLDHLAPWTGVYGLSCAILVVNSLLAGAILLRGKSAQRSFAGGFALTVVLLVGGAIASHVETPEQPHQTATLLQENLEVGQGMHLQSGFRSMEEMYVVFEHLSINPPFDAYSAQRQIGSMHQPSLIVWPESPAPFEVPEPAFMSQMGALARYRNMPVISGAVTVVPDASTAHHYRIYNSAAFFTPDGQLAGRYDKIHLVPWGEYVPYRQFFFFARNLTQEVGDFDRGKIRNVFRVNGHAYGTFICYESAFPDEVRHFAANGAQVLVNISNDGWYGDTSAPWQHLNIARMRAIENHRWLLRDTNTGLTASIDPQGRIRDFAPRHQRTALEAGFNFENDVTFYSRYGDLFAFACVLLALVLCGTALAPRQRSCSKC